MMLRVLGNILCDLDPKVKDQIMYFLVNVSPPKGLDVATSNFVGHMMYLGYWATFGVTLTPIFFSYSESNEREITHC